MGTATNPSQTSPRRLPRGSVIHQPAKGRVRYAVTVTLPSGKKETLDSSIKLPEGHKPRDVKAAGTRAQNVMDAWVLETLARAERDGRAAEEERERVYTLREWVAYADENLYAIKDSTAGVREGAMEKHWLPILGDTPLNEIRSTAIQAVISGAEKSGLEWNTVTGIRNVLNGYMTKAVGFLPYMETNPVFPTVVDKRRRKAAKARWFTPDEIALLLARNEGTRAYGYLVIGLFLGFRRSEILGLRWSSVDLVKGWLRMDHTVVPVRGRSVAQDEGKSGAANRMVPIPPTVLAWLQALRREEPDAIYVFPSGKGGKEPHTSITSFNRDFADALKAAGFYAVKEGEERPSSHTMRHSFSVYLGQSGLDDYHQDYLFGHSPRNLRGKVYRKPVYALLPSAMARIESMILGKIPIADPDAPDIEIQGS